MIPFVLRICLFLFGSGFCALVYQIAWLRLLRLIFGSSTTASAAVLAIFMGGLGLGGWLLGRRSDRAANPLDFYARLEVGISVAAALSVFLIAAVRAIYIGVGGTETLGELAGNGARLLLSVLVLAVPTFLMGGTLPATVRAVTRAADSGRHSVGLLYAVNTLGAVAGAVLTTFVLLELVGIRQTIWLAALLNLLIAVAARSTARERGMLESGGGEAPASGEDAADTAPTARPVFVLVLIAACVVGFVFFLMELVWYRMMGPILGGSTYTFGIILAVALLGIGAGGLIYGVTAADRRPTVLHFAGTCALEALCLAIPFALGDRIAFLALQIRDLQAAGFTALALGWSLVTAIVVLPAAIVAGYQFPVLVAILGSGRKRVAREVGLTYAWNTVGAILGSIAGGFGLIPLLSAPVAWRLSVGLLCGLAVVFLVRALREGGGLGRLAPSAAACLVALVLASATGPTAFWRHSGIGAGRLRVSAQSPNELRDVSNVRRRAVFWEVDGHESSVSLIHSNGFSFYVNGKSDGNARGDAPTQVMSPLVGAVLHPRPVRSLVIGLGTGSSAGWLAQVPEIERVDVVELEPAILRVAEECRAVNHDVLADPKLNLIIGDGREYLLTSRRLYDLIFSEPSNPYRAGVSSLFTREFYEAAAESLDEGGIFIQWLQAYEVDAQVVRTAYATLGSVFPFVETWAVQRSDLLLLASRSPIPHDLERVAERVEREPFRSAMNAVWGVSGVEGFYSAYVASPAFAAAIAEQEGDAINSDDHPIIEFGFARHVGRRGQFGIGQLRELAWLRGEGQPPVDGLDWTRVREREGSRALMFEVKQAGAPFADDAQAARTRARDAYNNGMLTLAWEHWSSQGQPPEARIDRAMVAESMAEAGSPATPAAIAMLAELEPTEALAVLARWHLRQDRPQEATDHLVEAFLLYREDPWPWTPLMRRALDLAVEIGRSSPESARRFFEALEEPFAVRLLEESRLAIRLTLADAAGLPSLCVPAFEAFEPHVPWTEAFLQRRRNCYEEAGHALAARAQDQLETFYAEGETRLWWGLLPEDRVDLPTLEEPKEIEDRRSN